MYDILHGMKILELSAFVAAPLAGLTLSQLGAEVIRVDPEGGGLDYRRWPLSRQGVSLYWSGLNKGKRSLNLDLRDPQGQAHFREILRSSGDDGGIVLTNLTGPSWLEYEALQAVRPDLIMVTLTGHHDGKTAVDYTVNCATGIPSITGNATEDSPINSVMPTWDLVAGMNLAIGILTAERHRRITGEGQHVQLSLSDTAYAMVSHLGYTAQAQTDERERHAIGNHIYGSFGIDFPSADNRRVMVVALTKKQWRALITITQTQDAMAAIAEQTGLDLNQEGARYQVRESIAKILRDWAEKKSFQEIKTLFEQENICWGPYQTFHQMVHEDKRASLQNPLFQEIDQPGVGRVRAAGPVLNFSRFTRQKLPSAPIIGEDTEAILQQYPLNEKGEER